MPRTYRLFIPIVSLLFIILVMLYFFSSNSNDIVGIDSKVVFEKFKMTTDLNKVGKKKYEGMQKMVDSLYSKIEDVDNEDIKNQQYQNFMREKQKLDEFSETFAAEQSEKIWLRIGEYAKDFAKENNYKIMLGAQPNKNVIFQDEETNVSEKFLMYINQRYEGKN